mmetsp:Transcript_42213/g.90672  ORF Transcript_42213/g.90672 Transcript_42213/m.90672 type:complete len:285 (+) Transcript_42213:295-1149(+)
MSDTSIIVPEATWRCCCWPLPLTAEVKVLLRSSLKKVLSNFRGFSVQGPSKPERSKWQRPTVWAPLRATMSRSLKPLGWKIDRRWSTPCPPSGSLPWLELTPSAPVFASVRPKRVVMSGPPMTPMATLAAKAHKSALEMRSGQYFCVIGANRAMATASPLFASNLASAESGRRMAALGQPPFPCMKTPASCQDRRTSMGPQFFFVTRFSRSEIRWSWVMARARVRFRTVSLLHFSSITTTLCLVPLTSMMLSPFFIWLSGLFTFQSSANPPVTAMMGSTRRSAM